MRVLIEEKKEVFSVGKIRKGRRVCMVRERREERGERELGFDSFFLVFIFLNSKL